MSVFGFAAHGSSQRCGLSCRGSTRFVQAPIEEWGYKFHMNDLNAAIGAANFKHAERIVAACAAHGAALAAALGSGQVAGVRVLKVPEGARSAYWLFTLAFTEGGQVGAFIEHMQRRGVCASQVHTRNDHHPCVAKFNQQGRLPQLDSFADRFVCVPVGWWLEPCDVARIVDGVKSFAALQNGHT